MNSKKSNKKQILLSVLALLVILLVSAGVTYSWIEGGAIFTIQTENDGDVRTGSNPYATNPIKNKITLDPSNANQIVTLVNYDNNVNKNNTEDDKQKLFFSPVLSKDGENFFFPTSFGANNVATSFRKANTNDIGTKFIKCDFEVTASKKCYIAFNDVNVITATNGSTQLDTSAFRVMLKSGNESYVFTTASSAKTSYVVTDEDGTSATLTAQPVSEYKYDTTNHSNKIFEYNAGDTETMELSVWLDGETVSPDLIGSDVKVNVELAVAQEDIPVTFDVVSYDSNGNLISDGDNFTGGHLKIGTDTYSKKFTKKYPVDSDIAITAVENHGYDFAGWYSDEACKTKVTDSYTLNSTASAEKKFYAKFNEKPKYTITVASKTSPSGTGGTVTVNGSGTTYTGYKDSSVKISAVEASGYVFDGWYSDADCTTNIGDNIYMTKSQSVKISASKTYYAKFVKQYTVTFIAVTDNDTMNHNGGNVQIDSGTASGTVTEKLKHNTQISLNAYRNDNYEFKGIKTSPTDVNWLPSGVKQTITSDCTYYAYFETKPASTTTIYFESRSDFDTYSAYVYRKVNGITTHYSGNWPGESATLDSTTGYYKYEFSTGDTGKFNVIVSDEGDNQYPPGGQTGLEGDIGKTYLFKANNTLVEFDPNLKYTLTVKPVGTGGSATVNNTSSSSISVYPGTLVTIKATASSGYEFAGWYTDEACNTNIGSNIFMTATQSVTVNSNKTYYAKFVQSTVSTRNVYFDSSSCTWFDGDGAVLGVSTNGGSSYTKANSVTYSGKKYWYFALPDNVTSFKVGRVVSSSVYNAFDITTNGTNNLYIINSSHNGGEWKRLVHFDSSACSWFGGDGAVLGVSTNGGSSYNSATSFSYNSNNYWYYVLPSNTTSFNVGRKVSSGTYNTFSINISGKNDFLKINSNCDGGTWAVFNP